MSNPKSITIITVPTEAGTHFPGQALAPDALLKAGLGFKLEERGHKIAIEHALQIPQRWRASQLQNGVKDEANTLKVMHQVRSAVKRVASPENIPLVLGGDCSITPAVLSGLNDAYIGKGRVGLIYFDGDADLTLPLKPGEDPSNFTGILDSMVLSHLTQREGGLDSMKQFSDPSTGGPLIDNDNIVLFGFQPPELHHSHWSFLLEGGFKAFTRPTVSISPKDKALEALTWLEQRVDHVMLHFDVDVIDSGEFPLANYPHYAGLKWWETSEVLRVFLGSSKLCALVITEVNPNNDPDGAMVQTLVNGLVEGF